MKKLFLIMLMFLLQNGCSDSDADTPEIIVSGVYVNDDEVDYSNKMSAMPALRVGDKINISFLLDGNGSDLRSFLIKSDTRVVAAMSYMENEISVDFSDFEKGLLVFVDGVSATELTVHITILGDEEDEIPLYFYLSSKVANGEGSSVSIILKTNSGVE